MQNLPMSIIVNVLALIFPIVYAIKEKHFVKHSSSVINGAVLVITGISLLVSNPTLYLFKLPLATYPLVIGLLSIVMTSLNVDNWDVIGSSAATLIILVLILLTQFVLRST